jgi:hypothetical protein
MKKERSMNKLREVIRQEIRRQLREGGGYDDVDHAIDNLEQVIKFADMIRDTLPEDMDLPGWVLDKFAVAAREMNDVYQYLEDKYRDNEVVID